MSEFKLEVPHQIGQEQATVRLKGFLKQVRERYESQVSDLEESWNDNTLQFSFKAYNFDIGGNLSVQADTVSLKGNLPLAAFAFRRRIEQTIRDELEKLLS